ncbi:MAG: glycosyltransferase [Patescibacteria group bacterium]|nr:glycosyltransferase [Patescibacteria group bacterium]MBU1870510.1 glycosyltransferase [Patescibacteria group bacterium]
MINKDKQLKIAVIHDHLGFCGGGERTVLLIALDLGADFITAYAHKDTFPDYQKQLGKKLILFSKKIVTTRVIRFFWIRWLFWHNRKSLLEYDIVITSSNIATEMMARYINKEALKITYTHSTPRRVFDQYEYSKKSYPLVLRSLFVIFVQFWKWFYLRSIFLYNINIANSNCVKKRIKSHTRGEANAVLYPPIIIDKFKWLEQGDYFFSWGRVDELKRIELIVKAFGQRLEEKLIIASGGPRLEAVKKLAANKPNIKILGWISDENLFKLVGNCRAAVYIPVNEDSGMTHLEANAAGKPVLGVKEGGLIESVIDKETGILIKENPKEEDIISAIKIMNADWCLKRKEICINHAKKYSKESFLKELRNIIDRNDPRKFLIGIDASRWEYIYEQCKSTRVCTGACERTCKRIDVETYSKNLIKNLILLAQARGFRIRIYTPRTIKDLPLEIQKVIPYQRFWTIRALKRELKYSPPDYFISSKEIIAIGKEKSEEILWEDIAKKILIKIYAKSKTVS